MKDDFLPSGPWTGFYQQFGRKYTTDMHLTFARGRVRGSGADRVGSFVVRGLYEVGNGEVIWTKSYIGRHVVHYRGFRDRRRIWGVWEIIGFDRSGFMIWPRGEAPAEVAAMSLEEPEPTLVRPAVR